MLDELKFKQILINLLSNAIKYTDKGTISFGYSISENKKYLNFFVQDSGYGISLEDQKYIFDRFKRINNEYTLKSSGLGLGLAITKAYIDLMNGKISLTSELGKGSCFYFSLPLEYATKTTDTIEKTPIAIEDLKEIGSKKILIAEDDEINFLLIKKVFSLYENLEITRAKNGKEALDLFATTAYDLVLLDIKMPELNGFEALEIMKKTNTTTPIIAQTAFSSMDDIDMIFKSGFSDYIAKPIQKEKLFSMLYRFLKYE